MLLALCNAVRVIVPTYTWEQWQLHCKLHKLLFLEAVRGAGGPLMVVDKVLPWASHVDDGCISNLVRGGCDLAETEAIVADLGKVVADAAAELAVSGKGGGA